MLCCLSSRCTPDPLLVMGSAEVSLHVLSFLGSCQLKLPVPTSSSFSFCSSRPRAPTSGSPPFILLRVELCPLDSCWSHNPSTPDCERQVVEMKSHCSRVTGVLIKRGLRTRGEGHVKTKTDIGVLCLWAEERRRGRASRPQQLRDSPGTDPLTCPSEGPNLPR